MSDFDTIVIGSGIGGLVAGSLLARYGRQVLIVESHSIPGGAAHGFSREGFCFDSGPSFYCGLSHPQSLNPLRQVLAVLGESLNTVAYDPLGHYHFPEGSLPIYSHSHRYRHAIAEFTFTGAEELANFEADLLRLYQGLSAIPTLTLRGDWQLLPLLLKRYPLALLKLIPLLGDISASAGQILDRHIRDPWVRRLIDLECFLLSGLKSHQTVAPEIAFMLGERNNWPIDYPLGGSGAIIEALIRGLNRWGGVLQLNTHVEKIIVQGGTVQGVRLRNGDTISAPIVISNATIWDTYTHLLNLEDLPTAYRQQALATPTVESFMHLHLGIKAEGLDSLTGHHVVVHDSAQDITNPGNTCMISIPSVWDAKLAPPGHHVIHAYTLEPFEGWIKDSSYNHHKQLRSQPLFRALEKIIPDLSDRITLELIGTPLTHARFLRRHRGTYGPAIKAGQGTFPGPSTPIKGLYRVGDSTTPGIGVPATAASGIICANTLVTPKEMILNPIS